MNNNRIAAYYKKSSFIIRIARYIVTFFLVLFMLSCILVFRNDITIDNLRLLAKFISLNDGSSEFYDKPFSVSTSKDTRAIMLLDNLALVDKGNISLVSLSGQKLFSYDYLYSDPAVAYNDHNILVYDVGGHELSIFSSFSKITTDKFSDSIMKADIATDHYAVITDNPSYKSAVSVYGYSFSDNDYVELFKYLSSSAYITCLSLNSDGSRLGCSFVQSDNGSFSSVVNIFDVSSSSEKALYSVEIQDELPVEMGYSKDDSHLYVITDSGIHFYDSKLSNHTFHKFNQSMVQSYYQNDSYILVTEKNNLSGVSMKLSCFEKNGRHIFTTSVNDNILDVCFSDKYVFALGETTAYRVNRGGDEIAQLPLSEKYNCIVSDTKDNAYIIDNISVSKLSF